MPYLIDGHNLIPKIPGMSLQDPDDEERLIKRLQEFCRRTRKQVEVFFDNAPAGNVRSQNFGLLQARFVRQGATADRAIAERLSQLKRAARNWTVVSSDQAVQMAARFARARFISSEAFAEMLVRAPGGSQADPGADAEAGVPPEEIADWLSLFDPGRHKP